MSITRGVTIGRVTETETARVISPAHVIPIGRVSETETARGLLIVFIPHVTYRLIGGDCGLGGASIMPCVRLSWTAASVPGGGQTVDGYVLQRRVSGTATWTTLATVANTVFAYDDCAVASLVPYDYRVLTTLSGGTQPPSNTVVAVHEYQHAWLHLRADSSLQVRLEPEQVALTARSDAAFHDIWGRTAPVAVVNEQRYVDVSIVGYERLLADGRWQAIGDIMAGQLAQQSPVLLRLGRAGELYTMTFLQDQVRSDSLRQYAPSLRLREVVD